MSDKDGAVADLVSLKADHPALIGLDGDACLDAWIFSGGRGLVDCVWSGGVMRVARGRHLNGAAILEGYASRMKKRRGTPSRVAK